jgi:hypothetical protein
MVDPLLETYNCKHCGTKSSIFVERSDETGLFWYEKKVGRKIHEDKVPEHDGTEDWSYQPDWQGDSTYWYKYEKEWSMDYFDTIKCPNCKRKTEKRASIYYFSVGEGRNSYKSLKERMRYAHEGMDKKQAEKFYKESCEASKDRVKSGDQHYKRVVPNFKVLEQEGLAKRVSDEQSLKNRENLKQANISITKDGTIGKANRRK